METKICCKCKRTLPKDSNHFHVCIKNKDGFKYQCRECRNSYFKKDGHKRCPTCKQFLPENSEYFYKSKRTGLKSECIKCHSIRARKYREIHLDECKQKSNIRHKAWAKRNKSRIASYQKDYNKVNKEKRAEYMRNYVNKRRSTDPAYRITCLLRLRLYHALADNYKSSSTRELLGCSIDTLMLYLQLSALANGYLDFNIYDYNRKDYHIDHIKPCSSFDLSKPEEQRKCFHYSNLQILTAEENLKKGDS